MRWMLAWMRKVEMVVTKRRETSEGGGLSTEWGGEGLGSKFGR